MLLNTVVFIVLVGLAAHYLWGSVKEWARIIYVRMTRD